MDSAVAESSNLPNRNHNNPPEVIDLASEVAQSVSDFMSFTPVVEDEVTARAMKLQIDRVKLCVKDLEAERDGKVRPLNEQVDVINSKYRKPRTMLGNLLSEMLKRVHDFVKKEEHIRQMVALEAERKAKEAEQAAIEAERIERERLDDAANGEVGINVAEVTADADEAFEAYEKAERQAIIAKKDIHIKIGGGLSRAIGVKEREVLSVKEPFLAMMMMGVTPDIQEAILKSARAWRRVHGKLPDGIAVTMERHL